MALPAEKLVPRLLADNLTPEGVQKLASTFGEGWTALRARLRAAPPPENSPEENEAVGALLSLIAKSMLADGVGADPERTAVMVTLRTSIQPELERLVRREIVSADTEWKLALRHLQQALEVFGELMDVLDRLLIAGRGLMLPDEQARILAGLSSAPHSDVLTTAPFLFATMRLELYLFVAFDLLDGAPIEEFTVWARRSVVASRGARALAAAGLADLRSEVSRLRAQHAWDDWDAEELDREFASWPPSRP